MESYANRPRRIGRLSRRRLGFEFDFQRYQRLFKGSEVFLLGPSSPPNCRPGVSDPCTDIDTDASGVMGNVVLPIRIHGATKGQHFGSAALGMIRAWTMKKTEPGTTSGSTSAPT